MELKEAFKIVLELAESAILTEEQAESEGGALDKERDKQMDAVDKVENFWEKFAEVCEL